ncbi:MAG: 3-hydroxybutyryl-CoA dehydrogenase [Chitinophagaceae bacterium]|nr:3-hydroxybutyryl-CoA dehydrogenase [Chitinophagaceae bacterium]MCW5905815.1 3-hydroxybutyryl-CoA dehydrogenase [Chitinophagaceae bacterium]
MNNVHTICVCGAGTMGSGIAQVAAQANYTTILFDVNEAMLDKAKIGIEKSLQTLIAKQKITQEQQIAILKNLTFTNNINHCQADLIIEAIIEKQEAKVNLFNQLAAINNSHTIFATNTSSISVNAIANACNNTAQIVGMHFFNPATIMKLVEIVKADTTSNAVITTLTTVCKQMNKVAVVCKDAPGFIVNRVARHYYLEALKLVEQDLATYENIDSIMEASGFKMGPFKLIDLIGMDINFSVSNIVWEALDKPARLQPSIVQKQKVAAGELGRKTGKGFYSY